LLLELGSNDQSLHITLALLHYRDLWLEDSIKEGEYYFNFNTSADQEPDEELCYLVKNCGSGRFVRTFE